MGALPNEPGSKLLLGLLTTAVGLVISWSTWVSTRIYAHAEQIAVQQVEIRDSKVQLDRMERKIDRILEVEK